MTEAATAKAETHVATIFAETLGHDLMAAILGELRTMPDHWLRMNEENQQKAISRLRDKVKTMVHDTAQILMRGEFPAVPCEIDGIKITKDVQISLTMEPGAQMRHALYDAKGRHVLLVLADTERWLTRMDEIKAKADQLQLFDEDYDPSVDQPAYRRDQDRVAAAGGTWEDLKKTLANSKPATEGEEGPKGETKISEATPAEIQAKYDATFERIYGKHPVNLTDEERQSQAVMDAHEKTVAELGMGIPEGSGDLIFGSANEKTDQGAQLAHLLEQLFGIGMTISLGTLQSFTEEQIKVTQEWLAAYLDTPQGEVCRIARPHFLPIPDLPSNNETHDPQE